MCVVVPQELRILLHSLNHEVRILYDFPAWAAKERTTRRQGHRRRPCPRDRARKPGPDARGCPARPIRSSGCRIRCPLPRAGCRRIHPRLAAAVRILQQPLFLVNVPPIRQNGPTRVSGCPRVERATSSRPTPEATSGRWPRSSCRWNEGINPWTIQENSPIQCSQPASQPATDVTSPVNTSFPASPAPLIRLRVTDALPERLAIGDPVRQCFQQTVAGTARLRGLDRSNGAKFTFVWQIASHQKSTLSDHRGWTSAACAEIAAAKDTSRSSRKDDGSFSKRALSRSRKADSFKR